MSPEHGTAIGAWSLVGLAALAAVLRVRPPLAPLRAHLLAAIGCAVLWSVGEVWAASATTVAAKRIGLMVLYSGSIFLPAVWLVLVLRFCRLHSPERRDLRSPLEEAPLALASGFWLAMVTDPLHGGFIEPVVGDRNRYGGLLVAYLFVGYVEIGLATFQAARLARRHPEPEVVRGASRLAVASAVPLVANALYLVWPDRDPARFTGALLLASALTAAGAVWSSRGLWLLSPTFLRASRRDPGALLLLDRFRRPVHWAAPAGDALPGFRFVPGTVAIDRLAERLIDPELDGAPPDGAALLESVARAGEDGRLYRDAAAGGAWVRLSELPVAGNPEATPTTLRIEALGPPRRSIQKR